MAGLLMMWKWSMTTQAITRRRGLSRDRFDISKLSSLSGSSAVELARWVSA